METGINTYFIKTGAEAYTDVTTKWPGLLVLKIDKLAAQGKAKNIYTGDWVNSNTLDVHVPDIVCFEANEIELSFIVWDAHDHTIDVTRTHEDFISYITTHKVDIWSKYLGVENSFVCVAEYEPTTVHVSRSPGANYILGTIPLQKVNSLNTKKTE